VAFAARQGDVGKEMQHFARRRRRSAGGFQLMAPLGGRSYGRRGRVPVEPGRAGKGHRERIREGAFAVAVRRQCLGRGRRRHRARAGMREGSAGRGRGGVDGGRTGERRGAVRAEWSPKAGELVCRQRATVPPRGLRQPGNAVFPQFASWTADGTEKHRQS